MHASRSPAPAVSFVWLVRSFTALHDPKRCRDKGEVRKGRQRDGVLASANSTSALSAGRITRIILSDAGLHSIGC